MRPLPPRSRLISTIHDACMAPSTTPAWHHLRRLHAQPRRHRPVLHIRVSQYPAPQHSPMRETPLAHARHSPMRTPALAHAITSTLMRMTPLAHAQHPPMRIPGLTHAVVSTLAHANRLGANAITTRPREHHDVSILAAREHHPHNLCINICAHNEHVRNHHSHTTEHFMYHSSPIRATTGSRIPPTRTLASIQARFKLLVIRLHHETSDSSPTRLYISHEISDHSSFIHATTGPQSSSITRHPFAPPLAHKRLPREHSHSFKRDSNCSSFARATAGAQPSPTRL